MLVMYTRDACSKCDQTKEFLNHYKIQFEEKDIDFGNNRAMILDLYPQTKELPVILYDDVLVLGKEQLSTIISSIIDKESTFEQY